MNHNLQTKAREVNLYVSQRLEVMQTPQDDAAPIPEEQCNCVLPNESCAACRRAAREVYGSGDDPLPY